MARGTVYLVGAGPGGPGLLTVRAREILSCAEVVLYDGLVGRGVLRLIPREARKLRVAKGPREREGFRQSKIIERMIREARAGRSVVRLKGGDALLFSRGAEEALALRAHRIPFEVVPGVTSALAGPAFAGIPLTERGLASSVAIVTGRQSASSHQPPVNWRALGRGADTLVILMGVAAWQQVAGELLRSGRSPDTPVAAIQWATTTRQRTTLFTLAESTRPSLLARLGSPSVLVVGPTASRAWKLNWYPKETRWASARFLEVVARAENAHRARTPASHGRAARRAGPTPDQGNSGDGRAGVPSRWRPRAGRGGRR